MDLEEQLTAEPSKLTVTLVMTTAVEAQARPSAALGVSN